MNTFQVNEFITLKLEGEKTVIYIKGKRYDQCKALVLNIPISEVVKVNDLKSIDEVADSLKRASKETIYSQKQIPPETEFWGHCSNLQVWVEHNYDTRLLHSNLAFDLLRALGELGDMKARSIYKEEIGKRFREGNKNVNEFLINSRMLDVLDKEEFLSLLEIEDATVIRDLEQALGKELEILSIGIEPFVPGFWLEGRYIVGLFLEESDLRYLPSSIGNLNHLENLYLSGNNLKELPESVGDLTSLELLDIRNNKLHSIPKSIGNLKNLKALKLSDNKIKKIPKTVEKLLLLKDLSIVGNEIYYTSEIIKQLKKKGVNIL
ncbi:hypothetical protein LCGC14_0791300 [marine sediment metagenome]|uniref:Disease resistance R13L4/SHOC-2-like LRR domain-containing protein n=1 Tax=marine sediment metagenome TaxID=412755 RepID=A0A0F9SCE0_9ZZZZ|nr:MAG: leucine-rich repeat domain protein [Candidatus Lokiarchaeum sp. GC14_75]HEC37450.1 hypothetical protein [bacterium]